MGGITEWPEDERPREVLWEKGPEALSDAALLAILLRTGVNGKSAVDLGREILKNCGGIAGLFTTNKLDLINVKGMGIAKASPILAARELNRRFLIAESQQSPVLTEPEKVFHLIRCSIKDYTREELFLLMLDRNDRMIKMSSISNGTIDQVAIHPRELAREIINNGAAKIIVAHNHPSGDSTPSPDKDWPLKCKIASLCEEIKTEFVDFVIVGDDNWFSYKLSKRLQS